MSGPSSVVLAHKEGEYVVTCQLNTGYFMLGKLELHYPESARE